MPYSKDIICNMALAHVGVNARVQGVDTENSNEAIQCRLFFDHITQLIHETCEWQHALVEANLANVGTPPNQWLFRYKYPTDCVLALRIQNPAIRTPGSGQSIPFKVRDLNDGYGKCILTDMENAVLEYNKLINDPGLWSASFAQAHALGLGAHIGMPLRVDPAIFKSVSAQFTGWLSEAVNQKQREQKDDVDPDSEFFSQRG